MVEPSVLAVLYKNFGCDVAVGCDSGFGKKLLSTGDFFFEKVKSEVIGSGYGGKCLVIRKIAGMRRVV